MSKFITVVVLTVLAFLGYQFYMSHQGDFLAIFHLVSSPIPNDHTGTYTSGATNIDIAQDSAITVKFTANSSGGGGFESSSIPVNGSAGLNGNTARYTNGECVMTMSFTATGLTITDNEKCSDAIHNLDGEYKR